MAPPRKHDTGRILDAARTLILRDGPRAASVAAIARESAAPVGTLYHRFGSRDGVLAATWLRAVQSFQQRALAAAAISDPLAAAVTMATSHVRFAREAPEDARLLLAVRRDDLLDADPDVRFRTRLEAINAPLEAALVRLATELRGRADERSIDTVARAVVDLPQAGLRRHLRAGRELPSWLERDIATAAHRLLAPETEPQS